VLLRCRYGAHYVWGQLSSWYKQTVYDPTVSLSADRRGTLSLPDIENCYTAKEHYDLRVRVTRALLHMYDATHA
jgi:hypothetical protein